MLFVRRLPWILLGIAVGLGAASSPQLLAHEQITPSDVQPTRTYNFIGMLEQEGQKRVAIFSSETGQARFGAEGQTVLGQYKVLSVNVKSVTMSCLDANTAVEVPIAPVR